MNRRQALALLATAPVAASAACSAPSRPTTPPSSSSPSSNPNSGPSSPPPVTSTSGPSSPGAPSGGPTPATWTALRSRLRGRLLLPTDRDYPLARRSANPRYDGVRPAAVALCADATDVATALRFARDGALPFIVRAGGHAYPGWSTGTGLIIDVSPISAVTVDRASGTVRVGAGARLFDVYSAVAAAGLGIPAGSCPSVGLAGLALGGGVGVLARQWGLTCDVVTGLEIVTADGALRRVGPDAEPDLYWASRGGGGGSFGIATAFTLRAQPAPGVTLFYLRWPWAAAADVLDAWQSWAPGADRRLWSTCKLLTRGAGGLPRVFVAGTWTGPDTALVPLLRPMLDGAGTATIARSQSRHGYLGAMLAEAGCSDPGSCHLPPTGTLVREALAATSHVPGAPLSRAGIGVLVDAVAQLAARPPAGLKEGGVSLDALGGAVAVPAPSATAFIHRGAPFTMQYTATWSDETRAAAPFDAAVRGLRATMIPYAGHGAYVNYADASLPDWPDAYWGANYPRLQRVKRDVDPDDVFTFAQAVRP